jgi:hypothetical protein
MSELILPQRRIVTSWWEMVSPREEDMPEFLKLAGCGWRTPRRKWEDLWRLRRGDFNAILGVRRFGLPKLQRGVLHPVGFWFAAGDTTPDLSNVQDTETQVAPASARNHLAYDSDGALRWFAGTGGPASIVYVTLTTQTDDANNHTGEWWPDQPETNEGLNWDIKYSNDVSNPTVTARHFFKDGSAVDRTINTWYLLDTVSNDHGDGSVNGSLGANRNNGTAKSPNTGSGDIIVDVDIRATGSGGSVANHNVDLAVVGI